MPAGLLRDAVNESTIAHPREYIIKTLLDLSVWLINEMGNSSLIGKQPPHDPFFPSVRTLYERLQNQQFGPSRLSAEFITEEHMSFLVQERVDEEVLERPLEDFEDLYYAALCSIKDTHQNLNDHITSGFHRPISPISPSGKTIGNIFDVLAEYWDILNHPGCGKAFGDAIRAANFEANRAEIYRLVETNQLKPFEGDEKLDALVKQRDDNTLEGMMWVYTWAPAMISITLQNKYSTIMKLEKEEIEQREQREKEEQEEEEQKKKDATSADESEVEVTSEQQCGHDFHHIPPQHDAIATESTVDAHDQEPEEQFELLSAKVYNPKAQFAVPAKQSMPEMMQSPHYQPLSIFYKEILNTPQTVQPTRDQPTYYQSTCYQAEPTVAPTVGTSTQCSSANTSTIRYEHTVHIHHHYESTQYHYHPAAAQPTELRTETEWDMKKRRVSEYKARLHARASPTARYWAEQAKKPETRWSREDWSVKGYNYGGLERSSFGYVD